jgi:putative ABC transport system substrate-binding protein
MPVIIGRRELIAALGGAAVASPLAARAQQAAKLPTIGFLGANNASFERASTDAFVQRLRELGWIENRTVAIEYRWAEGRDERFAEIAAEFIRLKVDVILTYATPSSIAAKKATAVIPIVFAAAGDPVGTGLVASLARPGGNITGLSIQQTDLASKRLELLREVLGRKFGISNRMLDVLVAEVMLQRTSIHTLVGQLEPGRMPQHVGMDSKRHLGGPPKPRQHPTKGNC